jgi:hypothetical protein
MRGPATHSAAAEVTVPNLGLLARTGNVAHGRRGCCWTWRGRSWPSRSLAKLEKIELTAARRAETEMWAAVLKAETEIEMEEVNPSGQAGE